MTTPLYAHDQSKRMPCWLTPSSPIIRTYRRT